MDDDIFERLGKSLVIMAGGFGFLYLIAKFPPTGATQFPLMGST